MLKQIQFNLSSPNFVRGVITSFRAFFRRFCLHYPCLIVIETFMTAAAQCHALPLATWMAVYLALFLNNFADCIVFSIAGGAGGVGESAEDPSAAEEDLTGDDVGADGGMESDVQADGDD